MKDASLLFDSDDAALRLSQYITRDIHSVLNGSVPVDASLSALARLQKGKTLKKFFAPGKRDEALQEASFEKFRKVNKHMSEINISQAIAKYPRLFERAKNTCRVVLGELYYDEWFASCTNSSGTSIGVPFWDTSVERKFTWPISATQEVQPLVRSLLAWDNTLAEAISNLNSRVIAPAIKYVEGSRATTVPKTTDVDRMIAVEPTWNMFLQQGLMHVMYDRLASAGIDVRTAPDKHVRLAYESSIHGKNATIDFSSASDCVHTELLRYLLPPKWFSALDTVRCKRMQLGDQLIDLHMFSTMGNATTFPLETLVFWSLASAAVSTDLQGTYSTLANEAARKQCFVFGDDCILPTKHAPLFVELCELVGFIVNTDKSFTTGRFRESCGGDYLAGRDVRPIFVKGPTGLAADQDLEPWLYTNLNLLLKKYRNWFGDLTYVYDKWAFMYIAKLFVKFNLEFKVIPDDFPDDAGAKLAGDAGRFYSNYLTKVNLSPIYRTHHGTYRFKFLRYRYNESNRVFSELRYALTLRTAKYVESSRRLELEGQDTPDRLRSLIGPLQRNIDRYILRRKGRYVVELSTHDRWSCPPDQRDFT